MHTTKLSNSSVTLLHPHPYLIVHADEGQQMIPLTNADFWTIGRGYDNSIVLTDKWVSRYHATLQIVGASKNEGFESSMKGDPKNRSNNNESGSFYLVDFGSRNGSFMRGQRITFPILLKSGDRMTIGKTDIDFFSPHKREPHRPTTEYMRLFQQPTAPVSRTTLTPSEERVFWQVVQGFTNKEIGKRLQISPRTVQTHLSSIMTKLNLENRSQIVRYAFEQSYRPTNSDSTDNTGGSNN
ncbi:MAG: LuxR C-terminal-related transcriptional regulator [Pseudanabaena sp.]|jgi:DNA-binding CsgD family transcriptional regulator|nr:FHA domain-containing protein [Pseudanabaena sp. M172S2SP2A07QC]MCA6517223.1 FHA domain-containing protein [Pseudanabaena sp. M110S1SP2A07QC]MCA6527754.1 FHA domain-containing protein [Pseudanabaena sp. M179S2SP2A07QC]MCA6528630.1 FHA domain-containing protein [Pseudanabaena sp. M125S2SP2A07QC]MCA6537024.1 FHA domain-containing protein [Pseudanabaena sp. M176S2SP2A07QC]MCA6541036.1 FHA domain-containing protein [Pseudanabaena sp. M037S2SP2A07QC]MCA6548311.1 FHA domain-containing protein [P